jgi:hypothetical protein
MERYTIAGEYLLVIRNAGKVVWRWKCADGWEADMAFRMWAERALKGDPDYDSVSLYQFRSTYTDAGVAGLVNRKSGRHTLRRWRKPYMGGA